ncbi:MAG: DNA polymerase domain-containing protein, partial [Candidatus Micrarchaeaceae archaeon]
MKAAFFKWTYGNGNSIIFHGRDEKGNRVHYKLDYEDKPYLYVQDPNGKDGRSFEGIPLKRIYVNRPEDIKLEREKYDITYEAKVPWIDRIRYDHGIKYGIDLETGEPSDFMIQPRIAYLDIEVVDKNGFPNTERASDKVIGFTLYDSFKENYYICVLEKQINTEKILNLIGHLNFKVITFETENKLLEWLNRYLNSKDSPDIVTGWNIIEFDQKYLENRGNAIGSKVDFSNVLVFDLYTAYKGFNYGLPSYKLDYVAKRELGISKYHYEGTLYDLYQNDPETYAYYNYNDVRILVELEKKMKIIDFHHFLYNLTGCSMTDTGYKNRLVDSFLYFDLHDKGIRLPTDPYKQKMDIEGAYVSEASKGIFENVVVFDFNSEYPSILSTFNISPETIDINGSVKTPYCNFRTDEVGIFPKIVIKLLEERKKLKNSENPSDKIKQFAIKGVVNSFYGIFGEEKYKLYDPLIANSITYLAREHLKYIINFMSNKGYKCLYSDTDSIFFTHDKYIGKSYSDIEEDVNTLLKEVSDKSLEFAINHGSKNCYLSLKVDKVYSKWLQTGVKKRYSGIKLNGELDTTGMEMIRSDSSNYTKEIQDKFIRKILTDKEHALEYYRAEEEKWRKH